jgi:anti-anti-sigma regulatory factor
MEVSMTAVEPVPPPAGETSLHAASLTLDLLALRSSVAEALLTRTERVLVDVSGMGRPSSSAIAVLLWAKRSCARGGVDFGVRGARHDNREVLLRCGLLSPADRTGAP